jgi:hypothetical protein
MAVLLAAAVFGIGMVEKSVFVLAPNLFGEVACADGGVVYVITRYPGTVVQAGSKRHSAGERGSSRR